MNTSQNRIRSK